MQHSYFMQRVWCVLLLLTLLSVGLSQECAADGTCDDGTSSSSLCRDWHERCEEWTMKGQCDENPAFMFEACSKACGACLGPYRQILGYTRDAIIRSLANLTQTIEYVGEFKKNEQFREFWDVCASSLKHEQCISWASRGECVNNPSYMFLNCAAACRTCELLDIRLRCPMHLATDDIWGPGDLEKFFVNLTTNVNHNYVVKVLSQPPEGPWVVTIDDFLSQKEANHLIQLGHERGYKRSFGNAGLKPDGTSKDEIADTRTSHNTFCQDECFEDPIAMEIRLRIANLTSVPQENHEHLQLLRYDVGQYYMTHHDFIPHHIHKQPGPRILTVFLYLNDVEEGGGTNFPRLGIEVKPKLGRALIWSHILNASPLSIDSRTDHEALPVIRGQKYAANAWIHLRNYLTAHDNNCQ